MEWSIAPNKPLFSIHGASQSEDFYATSRSRFDYYDEAMAADGDKDGKLPPLTEVSDHGGKEFGMLGSKVSAASDRRRRLARPYGRPLDQTGEMRGERSHGWRTR